MLLALSAGTFAIAGAMMGVESLAFFTDQQSVDAPFAAATIQLNAAGIASLSLTSANLMPGDTTNSSVTVQNDGGSQLRYAVSATSTNSDGLNIRRRLRLTVKTVGTDCNTFDGTQLFNAVLGTSKAIIGKPTQGAQAGDRILDASANEVLCFRLTLPLNTANTYKGATTTTTFTFDAEQTANNP